MIRTLILILGVVMSSVAFGQAVSILSYNKIVSSGKILKFVVPPDAAIDSPIFSKDGKTALIRFLEEQEGKTVNAVVETELGTFNLALTPIKGIPPQTVHVGGDSSVSLPEDSSKNPNLTYLSPIRAILIGKTPVGYKKESPKKEPSIDYGVLKATPSNVFESAYDTIVVYVLNAKSNLPIKVDPSQFYDAGVKASLVTNSVVTPESPSTLIIVRKAVN